jgi:predicted ArsR family transcriptional regulator
MDDFEAAFDLFGDPIPVNHGRRGRPQHVWTKENSNKIILLLAQGWADIRIANAMGISPPTLRKHYFSELKKRGAARDRVESIGLLTLWNMGREGNVAAMKEYFRRHDAAVGDVFADEVEREARKLGKKEQARVEAENPPDEWETAIPQTMQ